MTLKSLSKGDTLIFLEKYQHKLNFVIPKTYLFTLKRYKLEKEIILNKIKKTFSKKNIIIRSSALDEDKLNNSMAGKYETLGKRLHITHLSPECRSLLAKAGDLVEINISEDPQYHVATDRLA